MRTGMARDNTMTSRYGFRVLSCALLLASAASAANFGKVVPIGGHAADIALDERRGVLYIANFTANRIDVMSTSDNVIRRSFNVGPQPGSIALSPNRRYLVVGHYGFAAPPAPHTGGLTVLDLDGDAEQHYAVRNPVLGVAFGGDDNCLILTTQEFLLFDPANGNLTLLQTVAEVLSKTIPQPPGTLPPDITTASMAASGDGLLIHGFTGDLTFIYDVASRTVSASGYSASPTLGPRVASVSQDGLLVATGWGVTNYANSTLYEFPNPNGALSIGTHVIDGVPAGRPLRDHYRSALR
jgi:DNA-binding beta-propeller fold protein YncE